MACHLAGNSLTDSVCKRPSSSWVDECDLTLPKWISPECIAIIPKIAEMANARMVNARMANAEKWRRLRMDMSIDWVELGGSV